MYLQTLSKDQFIDLFRTKESPTLDEFRHRLRIVSTTGKFYTYDEYLARNSSNNRLERADAHIERLYRMLVLEPEVPLAYLHRYFIQMPKPIEYYLEMNTTPCFKDGVFNGRTNVKYGKVCKSINAETAFETERGCNTGYSQESSPFELWRRLFQQFVICANFVAPYMFDLMEKAHEDDYGLVMRIWMSFMSKPSVLNPHTYHAILNELFEGETLFAPVMSWNAAQVAFYNSNFKHFISTDVIPSVVENGHRLHHAYTTHQSSKVVPDDKTIDLYCCPSERLQERYSFIDKYRGRVDAILFCPPYFKLEIYKGGEQSIESFPEYGDWMKGYWEETVKLCSEVLRPGGRLGFIISNYSPEAKTAAPRIPISEDMSEVAGRYLKAVERYKVQWGVFKTSRTTEKHKDGNLEDLWLFEKA